MFVLYFRKTRTNIRNGGIHVKLLYKKYFNTIMLACMIFILSLLFSFSLEKDSQNEFQSVRINEGDTLWSIANQYEASSLTKVEFIDWIEEHNEVRADTLQPGEIIVIPVKRELVRNLTASK
jgi:cell division protein YceG involved in septum cleavage